MTGTNPPGRPARWKKALVAGLVALVVVLGAFRIASSAAVIHRLTYVPTPLPPEHRDPGVWGADATEVWLVSQDGVRLHGWWFEAVAAPGDRCGVIVHMHGNAGNLASRRSLAEALASAGHAVLLFDYRGYGASDGTPDEAGLYADGIAAYRFVTEYVGAPADRVVLLSHSLGSAVATEVARDHPVGALVLGAPFTSLPEAARAKLRVIPRWLFDWDEGRFDAAADVRHIAAPILVGHGTRDDLVTESVARDLFEAAGGPKKWVAIEGADHNGMFTHGFLATVDGFIRHRLGCDEPDGTIWRD